MSSIFSEKIEIGSYIHPEDSNETFVIDSILEDLENNFIVIRASNGSISIYLVNIRGKWYSEQSSMFIGYNQKSLVKFERIPRNFKSSREFRMIDLVRKHRDKNWNFYYLSANPNITIEDIEEDLSRNDPLEWNMSGISENPNLTAEFIEAHLDSDFNWKAISKNPNITLEFIEDHLNDKRWKWDWTGISKNPNINQEFIEARSDDKRWKWDWNGLSANPNITPEFIEYHSKKFSFWYPSNVYGIRISGLLNINPEFIESRINDKRFIWDWHGISKHRNITTEFIDSHIDWRWNWYSISKNPNLNSEFIEAHIDDKRYEWNWGEISKHPNITPEFIESHLNDKRYQWNWLEISKNPNITPEFIEAHLNNKMWKWRFEEISTNPNVTPEFIEAHINDDWDWYSLSRNPNITPEFIDKHMDKFCYGRNFDEITINKFGWKDPLKQVLIKAARS